jgi:hypothetical protein
MTSLSGNNIGVSLDGEYGKPLCYDRLFVHEGIMQGCADRLYVCSPLSLIYLVSE